MKPIFLEIHGGDYTVNLALISSIEWGADSAEVTILGESESYTFEREDYTVLVAFVNQHAAWIVE